MRNIRNGMQRRVFLVFIFLVSVIVIPCQCRRIVSKDESLVQSKKLRNRSTSECFTDWKFLSVAVMTSYTLEEEMKTFYICPNTVMNVERPIEIPADGYEFVCGVGHTIEDGRNCVIRGGWAHFKIIGSVKKIYFRNLSFLDSSVASIIAAGEEDASVDFVDCVWLSNVGKTAILIYNEAKGVPITDQVIISDLVESRKPSMTVRCMKCIFAKNQQLEHGTILSFGGSVSFKRTLFVGNLVNVGLISSKYDGSVAISDSCFLINQALLPGIVRVDDGGLLTANKDTFGWNNTIRFGSCEQVFLEVGESCTDNSGVKCIGICADFTTQDCQLDLQDPKILSVLESVDLLYVLDLLGRDDTDKGIVQKPEATTEKDEPVWGADQVRWLVYIIGGAAAGGVALCAAITFSFLICRSNKIEYTGVASDANEINDQGGSDSNSNQSKKRKKYFPRELEQINIFRRKKRKRFPRELEQNNDEDILSRDEEESKSEEEEESNENNQSGEGDNNSETNSNRRKEKAKSSTDGTPHIGPGKRRGSNNRRKKKPPRRSSSTDTIVIVNPPKLKKSSNDSDPNDPKGSRTRSFRLSFQGKGSPDDPDHIALLNNIQTLIANANSNANSNNDEAKQSNDLKGNQQNSFYTAVTKSTKDSSGRSLKDSKTKLSVEKENESDSSEYDDDVLELQHKNISRPPEQKENRRKQKENRRNVKPSAKKPNKDMIDLLDDVQEESESAILREEDNLSSSKSNNNSSIIPSRLENKDSVAMSTESNTSTQFHSAVSDFNSAIPNGNRSLAKSNVSGTSSVVRSDRGNRSLAKKTGSGNSTNRDTRRTARSTVSSSGVRSNKSRDNGMSGRSTMSAGPLNSTNRYQKKGSGMSTISGPGYIGRHGSNEFRKGSNRSNNSDTNSVMSYGRRSVFSAPISSNDDRSITSSSIKSEMNSDDVKMSVAKQLSRERSADEEIESFLSAESQSRIEQNRQMFEKSISQTKMNALRDSKSRHRRGHDKLMRSISKTKLKAGKEPDLKWSFNKKG